MQCLVNFYPSEDKVSGSRAVTFLYNSKSVFLLVSLSCVTSVCSGSKFLQKRMWETVGRIKFIYKTVNHWEGKKCLVVFHAMEGRWFGGHRWWQSGNFLGCSVLCHWGLNSLVKHSSSNPASVAIIKSGMGNRCFLCCEEGMLIRFSYIH